MSEWDQFKKADDEWDQFEKLSDSEKLKETTAQVEKEVQEETTSELFAVAKNFMDSASLGAYDTVAGTINSVVEEINPFDQEDLSWQEHIDRQGEFTDIAQAEHPTASSVGTIAGYAVPGAGVAKSVGKVGQLGVQGVQTAGEMAGKYAARRYPLATEVVKSPMGQKVINQATELIPLSNVAKSIPNTMKSLPQAGKVGAGTAMGAGAIAETDNLNKGSITPYVQDARGTLEKAKGSPYQQRLTTAVMKGDSAWKAQMYLLSQDIQFRKLMGM